MKLNKEILNTDLKECFKALQSAKEYNDKSTILLNKFVKLVRIIEHKEFVTSSRGGVTIHEDYKLNQFCRELLIEVGYELPYDQSGAKHENYSKQQGTIKG